VLRPRIVLVTRILRLRSVQSEIRSRSV
jgi:hypothetical protein